MELNTLPLRISSKSGKLRIGEVWNKLSGSDINREYFHRVQDSVTFNTGYWKRREKSRAGFGNEQQIFIGGNVWNKRRVWFYTGPTKRVRDCVFFTNARLLRNLIHSRRKMIRNLIKTAIYSLHQAWKGEAPRGNGGYRNKISSWEFSLFIIG